MTILYNIGTGVYHLGIRIASFFKPKAKLWVQGRRGLFQHIETTVKPSEKGLIWFHCASLGEFEQGRPIIESIRKEYPDKRLCITFFSPSGYEVQKDYKGADYVFYLPMDSRRNAKKFIKLLQPEMAVFIKYEFWYHYLNTLYRNNIPTLFISSAFRPNQHFFKWYGGWFRKTLKRINYIFVQNEGSEKLLKSIGYNNVSISGDTRYDRVFETSQKAQSIEIISAFKQDKKLLVAGSTWGPDEQFMAQYINNSKHDLKYIIAPHEISKSHIASIHDQLNVNVINYSNATVEQMQAATVLIIDNVGMLSRLYLHADLAYVGGSFSKGVHNILEPATFGMPIFYGAVNKKHPEADALIATGGAFGINNATELQEAIDRVLADEQLFQQASEASKSFILKNKGAKEKVMQYLKDYL
jgi:3-deoxy-D-manno-octulosonic-acid transferase